MYKYKKPAQFPEINSRNWIVLSLRQDRRCKCNVTTRRVRVTVVALQKQEVGHYVFWGYVCSLSYPARNAHVRYCVVLCGHSDSTIILFSTSSHERRDFRKKGVIVYKMWVLKFCTFFDRNVAQCNKKWARYDQRCTSTSVFMWSAVILVRF